MYIANDMRRAPGETLCSIENFANMDHIECNTVFIDLEVRENMQTNNKIMDDIAKLATGAAGTLHGVKNEMEGQFRAWFEKQIAGMDLVSREEFETVRAMAEKARMENDALRAEIEALKKADTAE